MQKVYILGPLFLVDCILLVMQAPSSAGKWESDAGGFYGRRAV